MRVFFAFSLIILLLFLGFLVTPSNRAGQLYTSSLQHLLNGDDSLALTDVRACLDLKPNKINCLQVASQLEHAQGNIEAAKTYAHRLVALKPQVESYLMWSCLISDGPELEGQALAASMACYDKVLALQEARLGEEKVNDPNYIFVLLVANKPEAKEMRDKFLANPQNPNLELFKEVFAGYDRDYFLREFQGQR